MHAIYKTGDGSMSYGVPIFISLAGQSALAVISIVYTITIAVVKRLQIEMPVVGIGATGELAQSAICVSCR